MEEYEYSFKVDSIIPYIDYCVDNNYKKISVVKENRIIYENKHNKNLIARITIRENKTKKEILFDCKSVEKNDNDLKCSKESLPLKITKNNLNNIESILDVLNFYEVANNVRNRYIYKKNNVKFEIDDYELPKMQVIAIEGIKEDVDSVYKEIIDKMKKV